MTPTQRREVIELMGWSQRGVARVTGADERVCRRWFTHGGIAPPALDDWLGRCGAFIVANPPPDLSRHRADEGQVAWEHPDVSG